MHARPVTWKSKNIQDPKRSYPAMTRMTIDDLAAPPVGGQRVPLGALLVLALLGFLLISTETMPAGILAQIADGMHTNESVVGQFVSAYALGTVIITIPAIHLTRRMSRKRLFLLGITGFLVASSVTAISSDVPLSLASRFVAGGLSGMLWGMFGGYTVRITPPTLTGRALSLVAAGAPVGIAFGTPLGAGLGRTFGWRWSFGGLAILTAVVLVLASLFLREAPGQPASARMPLTHVVRIPGVAAILAVIFAWMLGNSTAYTYIAPYLRAGGSGVSIELLLVVFGLASIGGIALTAALVETEAALRGKCTDFRQLSLNYELESMN